jgi:hypothetical protein
MHMRVKDNGEPGAGTTCTPGSVGRMRKRPSERMKTRRVLTQYATRWMLYERLKTLGLPVECGSGGCTKFNRVTRDLPKTHWLDAVCVGTSTPESLSIKHVVPLQIRATGHGSRQMCRMDEYGFPRTGPKQHKRVQGFQTGDLVRAVVTRGTGQGTYIGKVAVRTRGTFNITTAHGVVTDIHHRFCVLVARSDGYTYQHGKEAAFPPSA